MKFKNPTLEHCPLNPLGLAVKPLSLVWVFFIMKVCSKCKLPKDNNDYFKTKKGLVKRIYGHQIQSSIKRNHPLPSYSSMDLHEWMTSQLNFEELYDNWIKSGYDKMLVPSVDRKNDGLPYSLDNIQLMTWGENKAKADKDMRDGKLINGVNPQKTVVSVHKTTGEELEFHSINEASRVTGVHCGNISECCLGKRKSAGGYIWEHKNN